MDLDEEYGIPKRLVKEHTVTNWSALVKIIDVDPGDSVWRGQPQDGWSLGTRIARDFPENLRTEELRMLQGFVSDSAPHIEPNMPLPRSKFDYLSIMQHYGAPTRLMDLTTSPYIALYFASNQFPTHSGALWRIDRKWLAQASRTVIRNDDQTMADKRTNPDVVVDHIISHGLEVACPFVPTHRFARMIAQGGLFCLVGGDTASFSAATKNLVSKAHADLPVNGRKLLEKVVISPELKEESLSKLSTMNITERTMYPGLDGLARSLARTEFLDSFFFPSFD